MSLAELIDHYTLADFNQWQGDWELFQGIPQSMAPSPGVSHQRTILKLARQLDEQLEECPKCFVLLETDWEVSLDTVVRPDIMLVCHEQGERITRKPELIIEVVSQSTARRDEQVKFQLYALEGVRFYLLIYPFQQKAKIYKLEQGKYVKLADFGLDTWIFDIHNCSGKIDFSRIWLT